MRRITIAIVAIGMVTFALPGVSQLDDGECPTGKSAIVPVELEPPKDCPYAGESPANLQAILAEHKQFMDCDAEARKNFTSLSKCDGHGKKANLCRTNLRGADLEKADLREVNLEQADLREAILREADLTKAKAAGARLCGANLEQARLEQADLRGSNLTDANLSESESLNVKLPSTELQRTNLHNANLHGADLTEARIIDADLSGASLWSVKLYGATWNPEKQPSAGDMLFAKDLQRLGHSMNNKKKLTDLRNLFREAEMRGEARRVTAALNRGGPWEPGYVFSYILWAPTDWGASPGRALIILFLLVPVFALVYAKGLLAPKDDGIWRVWSGDRIRTDFGNDEPELITAEWFGAVAIGLYFSLMSAFHIGWRDFNVGNWISRMQPREYTLRASGWLRTVSGVQSLVSVYLLAMYILTKFGTPLG